MQKTTKEEGKHLRTSIYVAFMLSFVMIVMFLIQQLFGNKFCPGIQPGEVRGLYGLFLYPFFHSGISHLLSNLPPLFFLTALTSQIVSKEGNNFLGK